MTKTTRENKDNINQFIKEITFCEVCDGKDLNGVLNLGMHPLCDDLKRVGSNEKCKEYPIEILHCNTCQTSHQRYQVDPKVLFPRTYHYRSSLTNDVLSGMQDLVDNHIYNYGEVKGLKVLDIGCNDASLLNIFKEKGALTYGLDPTNAVHDSNAGHILFQEYFNENSATDLYNKIGTFDIITFTNVFAHISNLNTVIDGLKKLIKPSTYIIIENHYLSSILKSNQFDTFYHEHPRTYSLNSFRCIAEKLGFNISLVKFPKRYGGNIRVTLSTKRPDESEEMKEILSREFITTNTQYTKLNDFIDSWKRSKRKEISDLSKKSEVAGKAFPGRAAILLKLLGIDQSSISCIYEKSNSPKIGHFAPGTNIPIKSDNQLFKSPEKYKYIINLAWHIKSEIENYLIENNVSSKLIHII